MLPRPFQALVGLLNGGPSFQGNGALSDRILGRRSCRRFQPDPIPAEDLAAILENGRYAPSTANMQTWTFLVFDRAQWREKLGVPLPFSAPLGILVASDLQRNAEVFQDPGTPLTLYTMAVLNAGIAVQTLCLAAEARGYATVMLSDDGRSGLMDAATIRERLSLPSRVLPLVTLLVGRPAPGGFLPVTPPRLPAELVIGHARYPASNPEALAAWKEQMRVGARLTNLKGGMEGKLRYYNAKMRLVEDLLLKMLGLEGSGELGEPHHRPKGAKEQAP
jgi:nitroreductase